MPKKFRPLDELNRLFLIKLVAVVAVLTLLTVVVCCWIVISSARRGVTTSEIPVEETVQTSEEEPEETEQAMQESEDYDEEETEDTSDPVTDETDDVPFYDTFIFVGDSRFVAMSSFADEEDTFVCETGVSFGFLKYNYNAIRSYESGNCAVIIGLGVNNLTQASDYIDFLNNNRFQSDTYFLSVNPTESGKEYSISDAAVRAFNEEIAANSGTSYTFINTYDKLVEHGYSTQDGVHYYDSTTDYLHKLIKSYFGYDDGPEPLWYESSNTSFPVGGEVMASP